MNKIVALCFALFSVALSACPHQQSGLTKWSAWYKDGTQDVVIPSSTKILLDTSATVKTITVNGELVFANSNLNLTLQWMKVTANAALYIGSTDPGCAITSDIVITLTGARNQDGTPIGTDTDGVTLGDKGIAIMNQASVSIVGAFTGTTWTRITKTALNQSSTIQVEDTVSWKVGDQIVIAGTDYHETFSGAAALAWNGSDIGYMRGRGTPVQNEVRTISAINGQTITLNAPLSFTHWGAEFERAEVGVLNRKITIQGDDSSDSSKFGGHVIIRQVSSATIQGVKFFRMGQRGVLGRYPLHFHLAYDAWDLGYLAKDNSFVSGFQRCITIHFTVGLTLDGNVAFNNTGHCYFLEDGGERGNVLNHNLGIQTYPVSASTGMQVLPTDTQPTMFWITNPNNTFTNNAAVGGRFGFWFSMPSNPTGPTEAFFPAGDLWVRPRNTPLKKFDRNVAHGCSRNGIHVDDMVVQGTLTTELASFNPLSPPYNGTTRYAPAWFTNLIVYKNREYGVWARGGYMIWDNIASLDNLRAFNTPPGSSILQNSLLVGETDNSGVPMNGEGNRSRPDGNVRAVVKAWETYDNGGAQYAKNIVIVNFTSNDVRPSGAFSCLECGPFLLQSRDMITNITFINANPVYVNNCSSNAGSDNPKNWALFDQDGSIMGQPGWVFTHSINTNSECQFKPEWGPAYWCPSIGTRPMQIFVNLVGAVNSSDPKFSQYTKSGYNSTVKHITFTPLGDDGSRKLEIVGATLSGSTDVQIGMANLLPRTGGYLVTFNLALPIYPAIRISSASALPKDWIYLAFQYPKSYLPLTVQATWRSNNITIQPVDKLSSLRSRYFYFYDSATELLYIRLENTDEGVDNNIAGYSGMGGNDGWTFFLRTGTSSSEVPAKLTKIPPAIDVSSYEDEFQADVSTCESAVSFKKTDVFSTAFLKLDPLNMTLSYYLAHDQTHNKVTSVGLYKGAVGTSGTLVQFFQYVNSPISFYMRLTQRIWASLLKGEMYVAVNTASGSEVIRGQIGCVGKCSLPTGFSNLDRCTTTWGSKAADNIICSDYTNNVNITKWVQYSQYLGGMNSGNANYFFNGTLSMNDTSSPMCGSTAIKFNTLNGNFIIGGRSRQYIDMTQYQYIQFYAKLADGQNATSIQVMFNDGTKTVNYIAKTYDIDNYYIDSFDYSRVRVPLSALNCTGTNQSVSWFGFSRSEQLYPFTKTTYFIDEVRLISAPVAETLQTDIKATDVSTYNKGAICKQVSVGKTTDSSTTAGNGNTNGGSTLGNNNPMVSGAVSAIYSLALIAFATIATLL